MRTTGSPNEDGLSDDALATTVRRGGAQRMRVRVRRRFNGAYGVILPQNAP